MSSENQQLKLNDTMDIVKTNVTPIERSNTDQPDSVKELLKKLIYECNEKHGNSQNDEEVNQLYCPYRFDGYACWPKTLAGTTVYQKCPYFVTGFDSRLLAYKECHKNGTWFRHPENGREWSNYTTCVDIGDFEFRQFVNEIFITGYILSLFTLVVSLIAFMSFRSLRCTRIRIHIQLFSSLALSCIAWITWYKFIVERPEIVRDNSYWCIILHLTVHYLMLATYFWMFCEGLHLHLVLVVVFVKDSVAMKWFIFIGWFAPIILVAIYAFVRGYYPPINTPCWMDDTPSLWILKAPVLISLLASIVFLINVVRVLMNKLHPETAQLAPVALQKALRATLILVPLFGLHYVLLPFKPEAGSSLDKVYQITSALIISLQGVCVSCLFCFVNHDVLYEVQSCFVRLFPRLLKPIHVTKHDGPPGSQTSDIIV